jgi:hypothetical protein
VRGAVQLGHSALRPPMAYCASPGWLWWWRNWWNDWQGKPKYSEKTCPSAALSTTNPTCFSDANPGRRGGKPASNRLSCGTALSWWVIAFKVSRFLYSKHVVFVTFRTKNGAQCLLCATRYLERLSASQEQNSECWVDNQSSSAQATACSGF